ncbi:hypothetical protein P9112_011210 [Eukaryota sp. TZLM1-RC]
MKNGFRIMKTMLLLSIKFMNQFITNESKNREMLNQRNFELLVEKGRGLWHHLKRCLQHEKAMCGNNEGMKILPKICISNEIHSCYFLLRNFIQLQHLVKSYYSCVHQPSVSSNIMGLFFLFFYFWELEHSTLQDFSSIPPGV